jgi:hypothetical protein
MLYSKGLFNISFTKIMNVLILNVYIITVQTLNI